MCLAIRDVPMVGLMAGVVQKRQKAAWGEAARWPPPPTIGLGEHLVQGAEGGAVEPAELAGDRAGACSAPSVEHRGRCSRGGSQASTRALGHENQPDSNMSRRSCRSAHSGHVRMSAGHAIKGRHRARRRRVRPGGAVPGSGTAPPAAGGGCDPPALGAVVMASGILSIDLYSDHRPVLSAITLWFAAGRLAAAGRGAGRAAGVRA